MGSGRVAGLLNLVVVGIGLALLRGDVDVAPLPNYKGDFVSLGLDGVWRQPERTRLVIGAATNGAAAATNGEPPANCSREAIIHYAWQAPVVFEKDKKGLLYGVEMHTPATRVGNIPALIPVRLLSMRF